MSARIDNYFLSQLISSHTMTVDPPSFSPADWAILLQKAQQEGVGPLLYWRLSKSGQFDSLPVDVRHYLRALYASSWAQNQNILKELEDLANRFNQADIPVTILKGACYALTIYTDIGLRPMGDLDLLVPKEKLSAAVQIAKKIGYENALPDASPGLSELLGHAICLQKRGEHSITLELHHSLVADKSFLFAVPVDWFWSQIAPFGGASQVRFKDLHMLTPTASVLYAASHAMLQHGGKNTPLRWYYDLDQLVRVNMDRINWDLLLSQAVIFEWGSALGAALTQAQMYFHTPIPENVSARLPELTDRHRSLIELLKNKPATHVLEERQKMLSLNGYARFRLFLALLVPSPTYMRWRYQLKTAWALPAYYFIRWWGIVLDFLRTLVSLFHKAPLNERRAQETVPPADRG